jgi:hypothetical protein
MITDLFERAQQLWWVDFGSSHTAPVFGPVRLEWFTLGDRDLDGILTKRAVVVFTVTTPTQFKGPGMTLFGAAQRPYWVEVQPDGCLGRLEELPLGLDLRTMTELEILEFFTREAVRGAKTRVL